MTDTTKTKSATPDQESVFSASNDPNHIAEKTFSTMRARFALLGHCLYRVDAANVGSVFLVTRWDIVRELPDIESVEQFYLQIGGTK